VTTYDDAQQRIRSRSRTWLVTGVAGFIGSHLAENLLRLDQTVVGLDNFSTGKRENLAHIKAAVGAERGRRFRFVEGDIRSLETCRAACRGVEAVLHQAALGSVPRSIDDPVATTESNVNGFLNMLVAARDAGCERFVYAASSSTYGDHPGLPKVEDAIGRPLSPYAVTKYLDELYAQVFSRCYGVVATGLRYFNVFGPRQDAEGAYAAVIPRWAAAMLSGTPIAIYGDGETTRDFCYVGNVVQANLLAATAPAATVSGEVYNVAVGGRISLNDLYAALRDLVAERHAGLRVEAPIYGDFRAGDVRHSQADIGKAIGAFGYAPTHSLHAGLREALPWYEAHSRTASIARAEREPGVRGTA
jgi:UDP-N-acetylglucosamine 4-epimerase